MPRQKKLSAKDKTQAVDVTPVEVAQVEAAPVEVAEESAPATVDNALATMASNEETKGRVVSVTVGDTVYVCIPDTKFHAALKKFPKLLNFLASE